MAKAKRIKTRQPASTASATATSGAPAHPRHRRHARRGVPRQGPSRAHRARRRRRPRQLRRLRPHLAGRLPGPHSRGFTEGTAPATARRLELYAIPFFEARNAQAAPDPAPARQGVHRLAGQPSRPPRAPRQIGLRRPLAPRRSSSTSRRSRRCSPTPSRTTTSPSTRQRPRQRHQRRRPPTTTTRSARSPTSSSPPCSPPPATRTGCCSTRSPPPAPRWGELCEWRGKDLATGPDGPVLRVRRAYSDKARDADGKRVEIVKLPKSDKGRRDLPLEPELARRLWRLQRGPDELLFTAPRGGRLNYHNTYNRVLTPTLEARSAALERGRHLGGLAHLPAHRRVAAVRRRAQRQAGPGVARPPQGELHARHLRAPDGRRHRRALALPAAGGQQGANRTGNRPKRAGRTPQTADLQG